MSNKAQHRYMVAGEVTFTMANNPEEFQVARLNGMIITLQKSVTFTDIGNAQKTLQAHLHKKLEGEAFNVSDVFLTNLIYLGYLTQQEFGRQAELEKEEAEAILRSAMNSLPN